MATGVGRSRICPASFNSPTQKKTLIYARRLVDISYISRVMADIVLISLPWQRGLIAVEFVWRHLIARPQKPSVVCKDRAYVSYISRVIADFVPKFVAMATGFDHGRICLASFNGPTPKTPC